MSRTSTSIANTGPRLSSNLIRDFEERHCVSFPDSYYKHLLEYNGGRPNPDSFSLQACPYGHECTIQLFHGINYPIISNSLEWVYNIVKPSLPDDLLPIACDGSGSHICIGWYGERLGEIYFWYFHDMPHDPSYEDVYFVSHDMCTFVNSLRYNSTMSELDIMLQSNDISKLRSLLKAGYNCEQLNKYNRTLIEEATCYNRPEMIQILYDHGANVQNALQLALDNYALMPEYKISVDLLRILSVQNKANK